MPDEWRKNTTALIHKNKENIRSYINYHEIKLMRHKMKVWDN